MSKTEDFFNSITPEIGGAKRSKMFGAPCIKSPDGKALAMLWKDCIVVKLKAEALHEALSLDGATLFEPMEGRRMKEWVQIPYDYADLWKEFALLAASQLMQDKSK